MKIVFTTDTIYRGGKERQLFILTRSLLDKGVRVDIITKDFSEENYLSEYGLNNNLCHTYKGGTWIGKYYSFKQIVSSEKPEILISWDLQTSIFALLLHRKLNFIFINASIQHGIRLLRLSHILRSITCFLSPYVIANSEAGLRVNNLKPGKRRFVLYNGIETKFINDLSKSDIEILRNKLIPGYFENPGFVYISVANFVPYKDYFTVLKELAKLKSDFVFYYLILGDGPMRGEIEMFIKDFNLEERVFLIGKTENVKDYLFASDIMIHSSRGEGISNAILEGMYAGLPIIATNVGGIPETVFPASSMLFTYKYHEALYQCLIKSQELKASFDPQSEEYKAHLKKFSVDTMVNRFEEIIEKVMEGKVIGNR
ncbi:MAG: glycosyltransferase [Bacteroidales bacterium]|nr:glycosyltransferase [Bacteroidales bacterium]